MSWLGGRGGEGQRKRRALPRRGGVTLVEVIVVLGLVLIVLLLAAVLLPGGRESARSLHCRKNLQQIGEAVRLYDSATNHLPTVPAVGSQGASPIAAMLGQLGLGDFAELAGPSRAQAIAPRPLPRSRPLEGLVCPADSHAAARGFPGPISYRASAGGDFKGTDGAFGRGRLMSIALIQAADGAAYTAAYCERFIGTARDEASAANYALAAGALDAESPACLEPPVDAWRGDAGSDWSRPDWVSSLYNHGLRPNSSPSCLDARGAWARMGASSAHPDGVQMLMVDGSARVVRPSIEEHVWRRYATVNDGGSTPGQGPSAPQPASDAASKAEPSD